ncbi:exportin-4 isoform X3 [Bemisia tabaci]|uniref:exportin-4 isoform X3 n=1 Tax=Bemisia tabaci TaxID=7038 RepID=UPI003B28C82D
MKFSVTWLSCELCDILCRGLFLNIQRMEVQVVQQQLETAAKIILAPPNLVTNEQRHAAEAVFLNLKKSKSPYALCRHLFESSSVDYVLFEAAGAVKEALIREWNLLPESDIASLRQYLLHYIMNKTNLALFVRERMLQVIVIMIKRVSISNQSNDRSELLRQVEQLILSGDTHKQVLGCCIITTIIQEYSTTIKSSDVGFTWEMHITAKKEFESSDLPKIFQFCLRALNELTSVKSPFPAQVNTVAKHLLSISESVLQWNFTDSGNSFLKMFVLKQEVYPLLITPQWRDILMNSEVLELFFTLHMKIRDNPSLAHHSLSCLVQLAGLVYRDRDFRNDESSRLNIDGLNYLKFYIESFVKFTASVQILDREALGVANIIKKIVNNSFGRRVPKQKLMSSLQNSLLAFNEQILVLTCRFCEGAADEESMYADDCMFQEAFELILEVWVDILEHFQHFCSPQAPHQIFNTFLKCHLGPPDGIRGVRAVIQEIDDIDEIDRIKFKEQLQAVGRCGREILEHSLPLLSRLIEERTMKLQNQLQQMAVQRINISDATMVDNLFEDIHWLLLLAGHTIAMESSGETPLIPTSLMQYSRSKANETNMDMTLKLLMSPEIPISEVPGAEHSTDPIIRLVAAVFRLTFVEQTAIEAKLTSMLSPQVGSSLVWFIRHWALSYLLANESVYLELSMPLMMAFSQQSEHARWVVNFILHKIEINLLNYSGEPMLIEETVDLLISLVNYREKGTYVLKCEGLWKIIEIAEKTSQDLLPSKAKRGLYKAFTLGGYAIDDKSKREEYWVQVLKPLQDRFKNLICQDNFNRNFHEEKNKVEMIDILERFIGVAQGIEISTVEPLFNFLSPILSEYATLIGIYHNYQQIVELILELFCETASSSLCFLVPEQSNKLYDSCCQVIQTYAQMNTGRVTTDCAAQEESFNDIGLFLDLLFNLLSKDEIDLSASTGDTCERIDAGDVCLRGLAVIMPLMTLDLLRFPTLCQKYYKLITNIAELHPQKICEQPEHMLKNILASIELGMTMFDQSVVVYCCDFLRVVGSHLYQTSPQSYIQARQSFKPFLKLIMDLILSHQVNSDILPNIGGALSILICCFQSDFMILVSQLISAQPDAVIADKLTKAFTALTTNIEQTALRQSKFEIKFEQFMIDIRSFLFIK